MTLWPTRRESLAQGSRRSETPWGCYFLFGLGYITYMTFVVAFLRSEGALAAQVSFFWLVLGASTFLSAFARGPLLDRARGGRALALLLFIVAMGAAVPLVSNSLLALFVSGVLFGGAFLSVYRR